MKTRVNKKRNASRSVNSLFYRHLVQSVISSDAEAPKDHHWRYAKGKEELTMHSVMEPTLTSVDKD